MRKLSGERHDDAFRDLGAALAGEQQRGHGDRAQINRTQGPARRRPEVERNLVDATDNASLKWRGKRVEGARTTPKIHEGGRGIVTQPRHHEGSDSLRKLSQVDQCRIIAAQRAKHDGVVQREARDASAPALREPQSNQPTVRMADDVDTEVGFNELIEASGDEPDFVVEAERRSGCDCRVIAIAA